MPLKHSLNGGHQTICAVDVQLCKHHVKRTYGNKDTAYQNVIRKKIEIEY
jgi:hypothetical protein